MSASIRAANRRRNLAGAWIKDTALALSGLAAFIVIWELVALIRNDPLVLVTPDRVLMTALQQFRDPNYWLDWRVSLNEYAIGMALAISIGVIGGAILGQVPLLKRAADPVLTAFYSTPTVALAPIFILWFGLDQLSKVMVVFYVAVLPITVITATGIANVDPTYLDVARVFRASRARRLFGVLLPAAMPSVISGIRIGSGVGLIGVILGEFFGSNSGLGYLILFATNRFDLALLLVGVISLASVGVAITALLTVLERRWAG
jgi:ABC-type nitrate/sulfonate/bicarbonate transport system permease component